MAVSFASNRPRLQRPVCPFELQSMWSWILRCTELIYKPALSSTFWKNEGTKYVETLWIREFFQRYYPCLRIITLFRLKSFEWANVHCTNSPCSASFDTIHWFHSVYVGFHLLSSRTKRGSQINISILCYWYDPGSLLYTASLCTLR